MNYVEDMKSVTRYVGRAHSQFPCQSSLIKEHVGRTRDDDEGDEEVEGAALLCLLSLACMNLSDCTEDM